MHKLGIVGCGWVAPFHVNALRNLRDRAQVGWVADPDKEKTRLIARQAQECDLGPSDGIRELSDYRQGLADVDAVLILLPHHLHCRAAIECLDACGGAV